jgi:long-chain fatty acid transport protein
MMNTGFWKASTWAVLCLLGLSLSPEVQGGGFQVALHGTKQIGMGHVGTGLMLDASSVLFNPGGIAFLQRTNIYGGLSPLLAYLSFRNNQTTNSTLNLSGDNYPFFAYATTKLKPESRWTFGLGVYTPFGLAIDYPTDWVGRYVVQSSSIATIFVQPTVGFKISERVGIGVGPALVVGTLGLTQAIPLGFQTNGADAQVNVAATALGVGANLGLYARPADWFSIGLSYRTPVKLGFSGDAQLNVPSTVYDLFPPDNRVATDITLPQVAGLGLGFYPTPKLTVGLDINFTGWSSYDTLRLDFEKNSYVFTDQKLARNYTNSFAFRFGIQYELTDKLTVRTGASYDLTPVPDNALSPELPDGNLLGLTGGLSYRITDQLNVDLAFKYIKVAKREATLEPNNFGGTYNAQLFIPSAAIQYSFGKAGESKAAVKRNTKNKTNLSNQ